MKKIIKLFILFSVSCTLMSLTFGAQDLNSINGREECFEILKQNLKETELFKEESETIKDISYKQLDKEFSKYYKDMSSFGLELREPRFLHRVYSFGEQTAYKHPPFSNFPTYTNSDKWDKAAKENIITELFVKNDKDETIFLGCAFMKIRAIELISFKGENYLYDGQPFSYLIERDNYKSWYFTNDVFDFNEDIMGTIERLFIWPKSTVNSYFNRYEITDSIESIKINEYKEIYGPTPLEGESDISNAKIGAYDQNGNLIFPDQKNSDKKPKDIFENFTYFQATQDKFPEFAKHIAMRGLLDFDLFKKSLIKYNAKETTEEEKLELSKYLEIVLDYRDYNKYTKKKLDGNNSIIIEDYDNFEENMNKIENIIQQNISKDGAVLTTQASKTMLKEENVGFFELNSINKIKYYIGIIILLLGMFIIITIKKCKK
ncbi:MAG: hypothetical protein V3575_05490 [Candidatus Absconditabacteria bacterium]